MPNPLPKLPSQRLPDSSITRSLDELFARPSIRPVAISVSYKKGTLTLTNNAIPKVGVAIDDDAKSWISVQKKKLNPGLPKPLATESNNDIVLAFKANDTLFKRKGTVTIAAKLDRRTTVSVKLAITQKVHPNITKVETILKDFYETLDARNWRKPWIPGETLPGVNFRDMGVFNDLFLEFQFQGLKGQIPESFGDLGGLVKSIFIDHEPGLCGPIPASFGKFVNLEGLSISFTGLTSVPDIFGNFPKLEWLSFAVNEQLGGPLYESMGGSPKLESLNISGNMFTGSPFASWARLGRQLRLCDDCLSGTIPQSYVESKDARYILGELLDQKPGYVFDISNVEIPGQIWSEISMTDFSGRDFTMEEVVRRNRCTVHLLWEYGQEESIELMKQLNDYYKKYHNDGLEILATVTTQVVDHKIALWKDRESQKNVVEELGCNGWYNYFYPDSNPTLIYTSFPTVEVYDQNEKILFSTNGMHPDPVRNRFSRRYTELLPFLEGIFGPK